MYVRLINANNNDEVYSPHMQYGQYSYRQTNQQTDRYNYNKTDTIKTKLKEKINNNNNQDTSIKCQISSHFKVYRRGSEYDVARRVELWVLRDGKKGNGKRKLHSIAIHTVQYFYF